MMKTAHSRQGQNVARLVRACFNRPSSRCRLLQSDVRAVFVIVGQIITPKPPEMLRDTVGSASSGPLVAPAMIGLPGMVS